jgi:16S rRNA (cytidine1402-2'-O)-methyltransferase
MWRAAPSRRDRLRAVEGSGAGGRLVLGGAPLGQPGDVGPRLRRAMAEADVLAVEDTRRLHRLAADLDVRLTGRVVTFHESVERARLPGLVAALTEGATVLLLTDAGMPSVSDPGYTLVRAAIEAGIPVTAVPGPSAVTTALALSGLPCDRFCFEGFLPRKAGERRARLAGLAAERRTMVFFESPHRLADALADAVAALGGDRAAAVCRELTKTHEEVRRGPLAELAGWAADGVRGEITLVVGGADAGPVPLSAEELAAEVAAEEAAGASRKDAIRAVVGRTGLPRRTVYDAVVAAKGG